MFPVPRITESFMDAVAIDVGWHRYLDLHTLRKGRLNADYLAPGFVIELKIIEEEGVRKEQRQKKLAKLFSSAYPQNSEIDIALETSPEHIRREVEKAVSGPIQTAVKKASQQIRETSEDLSRTSDTGVLLIVNNGFSYLNADSFERLVIRRCTNDSTRIAYAFCVTVEYHQGGFDAFVFCKARCHAIQQTAPWIHQEPLLQAIYNRFDEAMSRMMSDQMNPTLWSENLEPVIDIRFESDGVHYVRKAPDVPDSRSYQNGT